MNRTCLGKLSAAVSGVAARLEGALEFFEEVEVSFTSGLKVFKALIRPDGRGCVLSYLGRKTPGGLRELMEMLADESAKYDQAVFAVRERAGETLIIADGRGVRTRIGQKGGEPAREQANPLIGDREYYIKIGRADQLLKAIGIMGQDGKLKNSMIRKYNQIDHFVELTADLLNGLQNGSVVLDCGCGKSYLSFVYNYYLCEELGKRCRFIGIDSSEKVIDESRRMARQLSYNNMEFVCADLETYVPTERVDMVVSLHACDTATDMAIGLGLKTGAKAIIAVPCCHRELLDKFRLEPLKAAMRHGAIRARLNDAITDALRILKLESEGYEVTAVEYVSPLDTPKNLLIKAKKASSSNEAARMEYERLCRALGVTSSIERYHAI